MQRALTVEQLKRGDFALAKCLAADPLLVTRSCIPSAKPFFATHASQFFLLFIFYAALGCLLALAVLLKSMIDFFNNRLHGSRWAKGRQGRRVVKAPRGVCSWTHSNTRSAPRSALALHPLGYFLVDFTSAHVMCLPVYTGTAQPA